ncbi:hypothetical protein [Methylobacterium sp. E-066]|uniref:hypothetical protein n=1 Tax=Methylobacterium sp. E-066 TaxID=2836584 RepID=UPI001FB8B5E4|nr:hypothetical protein [Methylobacterium sp. E-066]MCJ2139419.1 hypothetical protein [Methylobacterium sp. E-066]
MSLPPIQNPGPTPAQRRPVYRLPLLRAVCRHGAGLVVVHPMPDPVRNPGAGPFAAIVDDRAAPAGPDAFDVAALRRLLRRVHGALVLLNDCTSSYEMAASVIRYGRASVVLVETTPAHGEAWRSLLRQGPQAPVVVLKQH